LNATDFEIKVVVSNDLENAVKKVHFTFDDYSGLDPEPDDAVLLENPVVNGTTKTFTATTSFTDPDAAVGEAYGIIINVHNVLDEILLEESVSITVLPI
jgi:hypothetical protein